MTRLNMLRNALSANPTKGHLSVVGWTSTPVFGEAKSLSNLSLPFFGIDEETHLLIS